MTGPKSYQPGATRLDLVSGWEIAAAAPGALCAPDAAVLNGLSWVAAPRLGTVAAMLRDVGQWTYDCNERLDAKEWWFRLRFLAPATTIEDTVATLGFDGLATVAEAWLNGQPLLSSDNMFVAHVIRTGVRSGENELLLRFQSLDMLLQTRRPRPRWRAPMVENQQLRWFRTTLLGRTPGWSPPAAAVGAWRPIWIDFGGALGCDAPQFITRLQGETGVLKVSCRLNPSPGVQVISTELVLTRAARSHRVALSTRRDAEGCTVAGELRIDPVDLWWPHTHGEPALYAASLDVQLSGPGNTRVNLDLGNTGFRTVDVDLTEGAFGLRVNGERIFCRGACWTPPDVVTLRTSAAAAAAALDQMVRAGMNMIRVGGTMVYETDAFLDACDTRGILLWQDFMFANMDYPDQDEQFCASVTTEARQLLRRLSGRPCLAVLCGNSEAEQQAAMWGAPRERWSPALFHQLLPQVCAAQTPDIPYWPSSTHGGAFPHQGNVGTASYYGVGAYLRPTTDARRAEVRFATECLAFANVPEEPLLERLGHSGSIKVHAPLWKARVPRDLGAGWDFDDVRDHYLRDVFDIDPPTVRYAEHDHYLDLSRAVTGEVMSAAFREWRRGRSGCNGALIWFLRDLWPGAGWGIIDASGAPKSAYYCLARLLQPRTVFLTDEGGNGLYAHLINETSSDLDVELRIALIHPGQGRITQHCKPVRIPARQTLEIPVAAMLEGFSDLSYAYRFGPAPYEAVRAALVDPSGKELAHDFHFLLGHRRLAPTELGISATAHALPDGGLDVELTSEKLARFVRVRVPGFEADDQYFHLAPGLTRHIVMRNLGTHAACEGEVHALNIAVPRKIMFKP